MVDSFEVIMANSGQPLETMVVSRDMV